MKSPDEEVQSPKSKVQSRISAIGSIVLLMAALLPMVGCRGAKPQAQNKEFFTSGSREADQRASQVMAKQEQLTGSGEDSGEKHVKKATPAAGGTADHGAQAEGKLALFDRLGGEKGIAAIVDDFTARAIADPRVDWDRASGAKKGLFARQNASPEWRPTPDNVATLKKHLVQFLSLTTGGPAKYEGKEIKTVHANMKISNPEFDAAIGDLKVSLDKLQIPNKEQKELLAIVESTRPEIVTQR
jgi:hemoglobin